MLQEEEGERGKERERERERKREMVRAPALIEYKRARARD